MEELREGPSPQSLMGLPLSFASALACLNLVSLDCLPDQSVNVLHTKGPSMADIKTEIAQLSKLSRTQLLEMWGKLYKRTAPAGIRRELMVPFLAYRIQEIAYGGLQPSTRAELRRIAHEIERSPSRGSVRIRTRIKSGSRILRRSRGQMHEVLVTDSGFEYGGTNYGSLSQIARTITGTRWSGPVFFGLKDSKTMRGVVNG